MNKVQMAQYTMSKVVVAFLLANEKITSVFPPAYGKSFAIIQDTLAKIDKLDVLQEGKKSGFTSDKRGIRLVLIDSAMDLVRKMKVYAVAVNNMELKKEINYSEGKLKIVSDERLISVCQVVYKNASKYKDELSVYMVTAEMINALSSNIDAFVVAKTKERTIISDRDANTEALRLLFKLLMDTWRNIDMFVDILRKTEVEFYEKYRINRKVKERGVRHLSLRVRCMNSLSVMPEVDVYLYCRWVIDPMLTASVSNYKTIVKKSGRSGYAYFKSIPSGVVSITAKKLGFIEATRSVNIISGERAEVEFLMIPKDEVV